MTFYKRKNGRGRTVRMMNPEGFNQKGWSLWVKELDMLFPTWEEWLVHAAKIEAARLKKAELKKTKKVETK